MKVLLEDFKHLLEEAGYVYIEGHYMFGMLLYFGAQVQDLQALQDGTIHEHVGVDREPTMKFWQIAFHRVLLEKDGELTCGKKTPQFEFGDFLDFKGRQSSLAKSQSSASLASIIEDANIGCDLSDSESSNEDKGGIPCRGLQRSNSSVSLASCESVTNLSAKEICSDEGANVYFERSGKREWNLPPLDYIGSSVPEALARLMDFFQPESHDDQDGTLNGKK